MCHAKVRKRMHAISNGTYRAPIWQVGSVENEDRADREVVVTGDPYLREHKCKCIAHKEPESSNI